MHVIDNLNEVRTLQAVLTLQPAYSVTHAELALAGFAWAVDSSLSQILTAQVYSCHWWHQVP